MKQRTIILTALLIIAAAAYAKKVKLTIDGTLSPTQTTLYLIINEDTANAQRLAIENAHFSVSLKVDANDIIRLHDYKGWPERSAFVLIPDSRHITIDWRTGAIEGSPMSLRMKAAIKQVRDESPEGFHIDVFSEDPEAWAKARQQGEIIRQHMLDKQRQTIYKVITENQDNNISTWIAYCYSNLFPDGLDQLALGKNPKWLNHPTLKARK